jgi:iron(III) transport system ATP-binding protein
VVIEPQVLLLDEPLSNLDAKLRVQMRRELRELQQKLALTTIFVTHDQEEANTTADRIAVINDGVIQQVGSPMALYDRPANLFVANFLGVANVIPGTIAVEKGRPVFRSTDTAVMVPGVGTAPGATHIVFRPQNVTIHLPETHPSSDTTRLSGRICHREFLGSVVRYQVDVGDHSLVVDAAHQQGKTAFSVGTAVILCIRNDQVITLDHPVNR